MVRKIDYNLVRRRGLMGWPEYSKSDLAAFATFERKLKSSTKHFQFSHPFFKELKVEVFPEMGGKVGHLLQIGDYELLDLELYKKYLRRGEVTLELGGGMGMTAAYCAMRTRAKIHIIEPNPSLNLMIERQFEINNLRQHLSLENSCVTASSKESTIPFYLHGELWRSTLFPDPAERYKRIKVKSRPLSQLMSAHNPRVLIVDIEGGEVGLFKKLNPRSVKKLFVEIHAPNIGEETTAEVLSDIQKLGFTLKDFRNWLFYFER